MAFGSSLLHLLLFTVFGFVLGNKHQTDGKISLCPYVESCIKNASKKADITIDISQCCPLCYCDRMCVDFSDCCPDVNRSSLPATNMAPADCLTSVYRTEYSYENASFLESRKYFQKRNCSEPFMSNNSITDRYEVEEKCEGNVSFENFDDIVMVSNMHHHEEVFFNKYCARCNGVSEIVRWNIKIHTCRVDLLSEKADLGPLLEVILDNCHVESIPPPNLQSIERIKCSEPMYNYTCDPLRAHNMTFLGEDTNSTCDNATRDYEFVGHDVDGSDEAFESYKCYVCVNGDDQIYEELCMDNTAKDPLDLTIILNEMDLISGWMPPSISQQNRDTSTHGTTEGMAETTGTWSPITSSPALTSPTDSGPHCSLDELYLKGMDRCVKITCPSHTVLVNKQCIPIANSMIGIPIQVRIHFETSPKGDPPAGPVFYNYLITLSETVGLQGMGMFFTNVEKYYDETSKNFEGMAVEFYPVTSLKHPVSLIIKKAEKLLDKIIQWNMTFNEREYFLRGKMDFKTSYYFRNGSYDVSLFNAMFSETRTRSSILDGLYICPHVIFDVEQYCFYRRFLLKTVCPNQIIEFNVMSDVGRWFYVLSPNSVGICIDTLQQLLNDVISEEKEIAFKETFVHGQLDIAENNNSISYNNACLSRYYVSRTGFVLLSFLFFVTLYHTISQ